MDREEREQMRAEMVARLRASRDMMQQQADAGNRQAWRVLGKVLRLLARVSGDRADHDAMATWRRENEDRKITDLLARAERGSRGSRGPRQPRQPGQSRQPRQTRGQPRGAPGIVELEIEQPSAPPSQPGMPNLRTLKQNGGGL